MAQFDILTTDNAPEGAKQRLEAAKQQLGFVPNLYGVMATSPQHLEAYQTLAGLFEASSLTPEERNTVWLTINVEHDCHYCVPAHTGIAKSQGVRDEVIEALRENRPLPDEKLEALRQFTLKVVRQRGVVSEADTQAFFAHGYDQRTVLDVILGVSHKVMSNYVNHFAQTPVDEGFKAFAWQPRSEAAAA
ncbi:carboxymuconolactone decarboxylase family protein [Parvularcula sp. ZS-1/3]|uniref:Carboxymuconolactone decarboxylase family protein n=1 Tax=Parvularcula mediterranea TaxID=2732508 RepID=A0A7Y3RLF1_9PROT|nr:carboxymuconolactone decarboxylase family protein [Parvularcula mediterranea]NNU15686.1 carboxymuconolactone decarboxylase family protein [Parvularcula mediterranea]